jgi:ABC-2 type transport system ATP-binding protein
MIKVQNLTKTFGPKVAVDGVSFTVERGEVLGFLGPNGAGKSTTMRMVTGFIPATSGTVLVGGHDMAREPLAAKEMIGYLPENAPLYADMTVSGFLGFAAELRGMAGAEKNKAVDRALELCFLEPVRHQSIDTLSKGYRHRTCFAQAIIHDPEVLVMDEPTDGLDPNQKHEVRSLIRTMGQKKAIIFSTHILEEVEAACSRVIIIDRGRIVANGTPAELKQRSDLASTVVVRARGLAAGILQQKLAGVAGVSKTAVMQDDAGVAVVRVFPAAKSPDGEFAGILGAALYKEGVQIEELHTDEGRMDDVFRNITMPDTNGGRVK